MGTLEGNEVYMRPWKWRPHDGISAPLSANSLSHPPHEDTVIRQLSAAQRETLRGTSSSSTIISDTQPPEPGGLTSCHVTQSTALCYAAWADQDTECPHLSAGQQPGPLHGAVVGPEEGKLSKVKVWPVLACLVCITNYQWNLKLPQVIIINIRISS